MDEVGVGATNELNLRVSVATLVRILFEHPMNGEVRLALERKASVLDTQGRHIVQAKSQPFGGAIRIHDMDKLQQSIGGFHFDSEESRSEQDFRILIRPTDWGTVQQFCLKHIGQRNNSVLEADPTRELKEEFTDTLGVTLRRDQYTLQAIGTIVEPHPFATGYIHARGYPTVRIYQIFEARLRDNDLGVALLENSEACSDESLMGRALEDVKQGGTGRINAALILPFQELSEFYLTIPSEKRNQPIVFQNHLLDETVATVLDGVAVPKYQRVLDQDFHRTEPYDRH